MQASVMPGRCGECDGTIMDVGDELVCGSCGVVTPKEVLESWTADRRPQVTDFTSQALGGYLGPLEYGFEERFSKGFSASSSKFEYLKLVSDFAGRDDTTTYSCAKMIERVCEKLSVPKVVLGEAARNARKLLETKRERSDITTAAVSAYAIISACKTEGITSIGVREIVEAHRLMGRRVKTSALIQLSLNSRVKTVARRAEDYVNRVISHLECAPSLAEELGRAHFNPNVYFNGLREEALSVLALADSASRGGHSPCTLAATAVYAAEASLARKEWRRRLLSQRDVAECVGVAEYTVREQFGEIFRGLLQRSSHPEGTQIQSPPLPR